MNPPPGAEQPRLALKEISKTYGRYRALDRVSFEVRRGELHGLIGQNGSGKSTLAKVLSGYHAPDQGGVVELDGEVLRLPLHPADLTRHGVAVVHQSLGLVPDLTVIENLRLGRFGRRRFSRSIDWAAERSAVAAVLERLDCQVDLNAPVGSLSAETKATLAIARAIQSHEPGRGLIIFDESTRALNRDSLRNFYRILRGVLTEGASVLLICHRLEEVLEHTDRVTVFRDGRVAAAGLVTQEVSEAELTRTMLGHELGDYVSPRVHGVEADVVAPGAGVRAVQVLGARLSEPIDLSIEPGEIVGLTGLDGSGFSELPYLLSGAHRAFQGKLTVGAAEIDLTSSPGGSPAYTHAGVVLIPRDRDVHGLLMDQSIRDNITLPRVARHSSPLKVDTRWQEREVATMIDQLGIRPGEPSMLVSALSGGNQQKVLLAKWLAGKPSLLLMDEPTQAVDVGARQDILTAITEAATGGCAVVIASSYADELAMICGRVLVFHDGVVVRELSGQLSEDEIIEATFAHAKPAAAA